MIEDTVGEQYELDDLADGEPLTRSDVSNLKAKRDRRDAAKAEADAMEKEFREAEQLCWEKMENAGDTSTTKDLPGYGKIRLVRRGTIYSRVLDHDVLLDSLEHEGRVEEMTKPGFEKKRLNEYARECLENGTPLPDGLDFYERRYIQITEVD